MSNLREREVAALGKMISIEKNSDSSFDNFSDQWKVLIYDEDCRDIISPLMNVAALRQKGVTLHLLLHSEREPISDAPAAYFVRPTEDNLRRIADDCGKRTYRSFFLHFVTKIERQLLEKFAKDLVASNSVNLISKVYDQYLDIIALEPFLFTLNMKNSFVGYNDPSLGEAQIKSFINRISYGLLSMVRLVGAIPVIRAPRGGAAEMLAHDFCSLLRENLSIRGPAQSLFADCLNSDARNPPLLLLFDRTSDMSPPLLHTSTYQALIDDLLDHKLNRVTIEPNSMTEKAGSKTKKQSFDLNTAVDSFFAQYAQAPIPEAVEANVKDLEEVTQIEADLRNKPSTSAVTTGGVPDGKALSEVIENLPEILARKKSVETHTTILGAIMSKIKAREVPAYFELEQAILAATRVVDKAAALALLRDSNKGTLKDKARLLGLLAVATYSEAAAGGLGQGGGQAAIKAIHDEYDAAFTQGSSPHAEPAEVAKALAGMVFLRRLLALQNTSISRSSAGSSTNNLAQTWLKVAVDKAASFFAKFVMMYVTKVAESLAEGRSCPEDESYCFFDPRVKQANGEVNPSERGGQKYSEVIVFVIGGGCYSEYNNLLELLRHKQATGTSTLRSVTYGCTELVSGDQFLAQLENLG